MWCSGDGDSSGARARILGAGAGILGADGGVRGGMPPCLSVSRTVYTSLQTACDVDIRYLNDAERGLLLSTSFAYYS